MLGWFYFLPTGIRLVAAKEVGALSKQELKSIRSFEKQIEKHEVKIDAFKNNPTIRPGMENLPKDVIQRQQQSRIDGLTKEIDTFKNNIQKILNGE